MKICCGALFRRAAKRSAMPCRRSTLPPRESIPDSGRKTFPRRTTPGSVLALDEFDFVAVRVLDEGDHAGAALYGTGLARDFAAAPAHEVATLADVVHLDGD